MTTRRKVYHLIKRLCDILIVLVISPVWVTLLLLGILASSISHGNPFFTQRRVGKAGKVFTIYKLKTMRDGDGSDKERTTKLGRLLRITSIDELPQVINILKGDMAFIGPRPLLEEYLPLYSDEQMHRHDVRPGLTGWAQVNGRNATTWQERFNFDLYYVKNESLGLDLRIILKTTSGVISRNGTSQEMPKFEGN